MNTYDRGPRRQFRPKPQRELKKQLDTAQNIYIGTNPAVRLSPPGIKEKEILKMPSQELQSRYKKRYDMFVQLLRDMTKRINKLQMKH